MTLKFLNGRWIRLRGWGHFVHSYVDFTVYPFTKLLPPSKVQMSPGLWEWDIRHRISDRSNNPERVPCGRSRFQAVCRLKTGATDCLFNDVRTICAEQRCG